MFKEFEKFDDAWRTHLGVEPYENRETDPEFKNPLLEHALSENKVVITHNLRLFEEGDFAKFAAAVGKLEHISVKGLTVEQSIPKELFYGSTNVPTRKKPSITEQKIGEYGKLMRVAVDFGNALKKKRNLGELPKDRFH